MLSFFFKSRDTGDMPLASEVSDHWHSPQFSKLYESRDRKTRVAMLITSPDPLFDKEGATPQRCARLASEIDRLARSKWASDEASKASALFTTDPATGFVAILEHASNGAYANHAQQIRAYYAFDGKRIRGLQPHGMSIEGRDADICVTV